MCRPVFETDAYLSHRDGTRVGTLFGAWRNMVVGSPYASDVLLDMRFEIDSEGF